MFHRKHQRLRRLVAGAAVTATASVGLVALAGAAHAAVLPPDLQKFANCPIQNPDVSACYYIETSSASLTAGTFPTMTTTDPMILQFGIIPNLNGQTSTTTVAPANGAPVLQAPTIEVPGGLLHLPWDVSGALAAYITPTIVGLPDLTIGNLNGVNGPVMTLDLKARVHNPFTDVLSGLGDGCFIGSDSSPIHLALTTGTTNPPPPNQPISGVPGTFDFSHIADGVLAITGTTVVDNTWGLPSASGCGALSEGGPDALDWIVDLDDGQANAGPGHNSATMSTTIYSTSAANIRSHLSAAGNQVADAGFEDSGMGPWSCAGSCGVDQGLGNQHSGSNNGWVRMISGWNDIHQDVSVVPNTDYTLTGWIRTSANNTDGYFGVRDMQTNVISEQKFGNLPGYTQLTVNFNSGDRTMVEVYGGVWALGSDTWAQLDDFSITAD